MNMEDSNKKRDNLERAKTIMGKIDPSLLSAALSEMLTEADEAEEADVAKAKKAVKGIYDSIPEGRDKKSILSKAITELESEIIEKEVTAIKENFASIDKETIMEAAKDYIDIQPICNSPLAHLACNEKYHIKLCIPGCITNGIKPAQYLCNDDHAIYYCPNGCINSICLNYHLKFGVEKPGEIDPRIKEQIKEEIIQEVLQRPELSRAMKKMLKKIQDEK